MNRIRIEILPDDPNVPVDARVRIENRSNATNDFVIKDSFDVSSDVDAVRDYPFRGDERIVIEPRGEHVELVYDRDQNAAVTRNAYDTRPSDEERTRMEQDRQKEVRQIQGLDRKVATEADRAADRAKADAEVKVRDAAAARAAAGATGATGATGTSDPNAPHGDDPKAKPDSPTTSTSIGAPQSPAAAKQSPTPPNTKTGVKSDPAPAGGMTAPGPSTGGQSSKDVKANT